MKEDIFETMKHEFNKIQNKISALQHDNMALLRRIQALEMKLNNPHYGDEVEDKN